MLYERTVCKSNTLPRFCSILFHVLQGVEQMAVQPLSTWPKHLTLLAEKDYGWSWNDLAAHRDSSTWPFSSMKISMVKSDWTVTCQSHSPITNGVQKGCFLTPTLFSIYFSMMLKQATDDLKDEDFVYIRYRLDGSLFNLERLQDHTKTNHGSPLRRRCCACFPHTESLTAHYILLRRVCPAILTRGQSKEDRGLSSACTSGKISRSPHLHWWDWSQIGAAVHVPGLHHVIKCEDWWEIDNRLAKANSAFGRLNKRVWNNRHLRSKTKISVYRAVLLATLLYGSESCVTNWNHLKLLERFHQHCLHTILNIHWSDYINNLIVLERADIPSIESMLLKIQLRWAGHVSRMEHHCLSRIILYGELTSGLQNRGALKKRYKDRLKKSLSACNISHLEWSTLAEDRSTWCHTINKATSSFESTGRTTREEKRWKEERQCCHNTKPKRDLHLQFWGHNVP